MRFMARLHCSYLTVSEAHLMHSPLLDAMGSFLQ